MPDQLLRAHEVMEYVYNVADVAYPVISRQGARVRQSLGMPRRRT
jgi:hypothetical protein